jgi:ERCC4-related helicase
MKKLLMNEVAGNDNARGIIFVKSRELARALIKWMDETEQLKPLNACEFVGQVASTAKGGIISVFLLNSY